MGGRDHPDVDGDGARAAQGPDLPGLELRIDTYGLATEKVFAEVPEAVAAALRKDRRLRVVLEADAPKAARAIEKPAAAAKPTKGREKEG